MIRRFTIHILAITAVTPDKFNLPQEQNAMIICTDRTNKNKWSCKPENVLICDFPDVEDPSYPGAFGHGHAQRIIRFINDLSANVADIYVCCSNGESRSPAVVATLLKMSGRSDEAVWRNPYYVPNTLVYYRLCREYGLRMSKLKVWLKVMMNKQAFILAQKRRLCNYERWVILE